MDRSEFPDGIEATQNALNNISNQVEFNIQRRQSDALQSGRVEGLDLSIGSPTSRFVITGGHGYTPRGDYVEHTGTANFSLADYGTGVENLVVLAYRETPDGYEAHEDGSTTLPTIIHGASELKVITRAEYDGIAASADGDFRLNLENADVTIDARDRLLIVASVFGKGFSGSTPVGYTGTNASIGIPATGDFLSGTIVQQPQFASILTAALLPSPGIPGINIKAISPSTRVGTGTLLLSGSVTSPRLSWSSPDVDGNSTTPSGALGVVFIPSSTPQDVNIESETAGESASIITLEALTSFFPTTGYPFTATVEVSKLYETPGSVYSATDLLHRNKIGSYVPTQVDPHGMGYSDFAQQVAIIPKPLVVGGDNIATEIASLMARLTTVRSSAGTVERTCIWDCPGGTNGNIRLYARTGGGVEATLNARWDGTLWAKDTNTTSFLWRYTGLLIGYQELTSSSPFTWSDTAWANSILPITGTITLGDAVINDTANNRVPRINAPRASGASGLKRTLFLSSTDSGGPGIPLNVYLATTATDGGESSVEVVINGTWSGSVWQRTASGHAMFMLSITPNGVLFQSNTSFMATINDDQSGGTTGWAVAISIGTSGGSHQIYGDVYISKTLEAGTGLTSAPDTGRIKVNGPTGRFLILETNTGGYNYRKYFGLVGPNVIVEETLGARWYTAGNVWVSDSSTAVLYRRTENSTLVYKKTGLATGSTWFDGDWDPSDANPSIEFSLIGGLSTLRNGTLRFSQVTSNSNPVWNAGSSVFYTNTLRAKNIPKVWGSLVTNGGGGLSQVDGYGLSAINVGIGQLNYGIQIVFAQSFANSAYAVMATSIQEGLAETYTPNGPGTASDSTPRYIIVQNKNASSFYLYAFHRQDDATNRLINLNEISGIQIDFVVFGEQA